MRYPIDGWEEDEHGADHTPYDRAERLLDQYGLAYVCQAPEILYGRLPVANPASPASVRYYGRQPYLPSREFTAGPPQAPSDEADLLARVIGAYHLLDQLFAPYEAPVPKPCDAMPSVYRSASLQAL